MGRVMREVDPAGSRWHGTPCPWPCRDRRRPAPAQLRRLDAALSACGGCQPGSGGLRWSPLRPCPPVHPAQARGSRRHARSLRPVDARCGIAGLMATTLGLPSVSVPVLVDPEACDPLQPLAGFGILDQHARLRAASDRHHDGHWRCQAERAGRQVGRRCCAILSPVRWSMPSAAATPPSKGARRPI